MSIWRHLFLQAITPPLSKLAGINAFRLVLDYIRMSCTNFRRIIRARIFTVFIRIFRRRRWFHDFLHIFNRLHYRDEGNGASSLPFSSCAALGTSTRFDTVVSTTSNQLLSPHNRLVSTMKTHALYCSVQMSAACFVSYWSLVWRSSRGPPLTALGTESFCFLQKS